jgi:hypothetical protein
VREPTTPDEISPDYHGLYKGRRDRDRHSSQDAARGSARDDRQRCGENPCRFEARWKNVDLDEKGARVQENGLFLAEVLD